MNRYSYLCTLTLLLVTAPCAGLNITHAAEETPAAQEETMDAPGMPQVPPGNGEHPLCWIEIGAKDVPTAQAFYGKVFGWQMMEEDSDYPMFSGPAGLSGAFTAPREGGQGAVPFIYGGKDMAPLVAKVEANGATLVQPLTELAPGTGMFTAEFMDQAGTLYGMCNMAPQLPVPHIPTVFGDAPKPPAGTLCSIELYGGDLAAAKAFFEETFGWSTLNTMPQYMAFDPGAGIAGVFQGHTAIAKSMPYIWVDDVAAKLTEIEAAGGKRLGEPGAMPGFGTFGYFLDPNGTGMGLIGP